MSSTMLAHGVILGEADHQLRKLTIPDIRFLYIMGVVGVRHDLMLEAAGDIWRTTHATRPGYRSGLFWTEEHAALVRFVGDAKADLFATPHGGKPQRIGEIQNGSWAYLPRGTVYCYKVRTGQGTQLACDGIPVRTINPDVTA